jgi:transposase
MDQRTGVMVVHWVCLHQSQKGGRFIILNAGGCRGFISNTLVIFKSKQKNGDYYNEMNGENYICWLKEKLIPNLESNSVLVTDNTPYHNIWKDKAPTSNSTKETTKNWLHVRNIPFCNTMSKVQLYEIIKAHKPKYKTFLVDIIAANGHTVLRLLPYHPDLNLIELIWVDMKQWLDANNTTFRTNGVKRLCDHRFKEIREDKWSSVCEHVDKLEKQYCEWEGIIEERTESILITNNGMSSSSSSSDSESDKCKGGISGVEKLEYD